MLLYIQTALALSPINFVFSSLSLGEERGQHVQRVPYGYELVLASLGLTAIGWPSVRANSNLKEANQSGCQAAKAHQQPST